MKEFDLWLFDTLQFEVLENSLRKAALFYGENITDALLQNNVTLFLNDKRNRRVLGSYSPFSITLFDTRSSMHTMLDCVFVHELAHFLDNIRTIEESRFKYASSIHGSKERVLAELFRSKMSPVPENRRRYRGRTCECFARAIEEYYALKTNNNFWLDEHRDFDYYVKFEVFENTISPVVEGYLKKLWGTNVK